MSTYPHIPVGFALSWSQRSLERVPSPVEFVAGRRSAMVEEPESWPPPCLFNGHPSSRCCWTMGFRCRFSLIDEPRPLFVRSSQIEDIPNTNKRAATH
jgi:hypothetical protein